MAWNETDEVVEARAVKNEPATFAANVTAAKQALAPRRAGEAGAYEDRQTPPSRSTRSRPGRESPRFPSVTDSLAHEARRLFPRAVGDREEQQQRLGRVEKQFGLPNSAASAERVSKATVEDVGWPLDLNKPKDRESVGAAISFHDL